MDSVPTLLTAQLAHRQDMVRHLSRNLGAERAHQSFRPGGPTAYWILGHLAQMARNTHLACGGHEDAPPPDWDNLGPWPAPYDRFDGECKRLLHWAQSLDAKAWAAPPAIEILPEFREHLASRTKFLSGHLFHLAYHAGQLGSLGSLTTEA